MTQALTLASEAIGLASPNPTVGCVIVREGHLVGQGAHLYDNRDHAEVVALRQAGDLAVGATAYVTLEPCSHQGRTPPCANALIAAGINRVVIATLDANPQVHGQGLEKLQQAGIEVTTGILQTQAQQLNNAFAKYIRTGIPYITLKAAMSLDGRIAPPPLERRPNEVAWLTGPESRHQVHRLRHANDAILTGIGTVLADDPLLTDRSNLPRRRKLLRVILDSQLRLPIDSKLVQSAQEDVLVVTTNPNEKDLQAIKAAGIEVLQLTPNPESPHPPLTQILKHLAERKLTSVLIEAGSKLNTSFLTQGLVDQLYLFYAPTFLGPEGVPLSLGQTTLEPAGCSPVLHHFGNDIASQIWLRDYWLIGEETLSREETLGTASRDKQESTALAKQWGSGTFDTISASLTYHFNEHGAELGATGLLQYLRKADRFAANLERSRRVPLPDGSIRYTKSGRYLIRDADGKILSFGLVTP